MTRPTDALASARDDGVTPTQAPGKGTAGAHTLTRKTFAAAYLAAFGPDVKSLALGIGREIWPAAKAAGIKRNAFNAAIGRRVSSPAYLEALSPEGAVPIGLDGAVVGPVSEEHRAGAIAMMTKNACNQRSAVNA